MIEEGGRRLRVKKEKVLFISISKMSGALITEKTWLLHGADWARKIHYDIIIIHISLT